VTTPTSTDPVPVAVVGAGSMGLNHVRVFRELPEAELVEVVEPDAERVTDMPTDDVTVHASPDEIDEAVAATVAVPTDVHREVAETCLTAGLDVLVEKPLAPTVDDAAALVALAERQGAVLQVGHIEQYNPAVEALARFLTDQEIVAVESHRLGPFNDHLTDQNVVFDLLIHDLDVVESLVRGEVASVDAAGAQHQSDSLDYATATMTYADGVVANLTASQITHAKVRNLIVTTTEAYVTLDYQRQEVVIQRVGSEETTPLFDGSGYRTERVTETPYIRSCEPLRNELKSFVDCVASRNEPRVDGSDGLRAVQRASEIDARIRSRDREPDSHRLAEPGRTDGSDEP
jgi:predicted dehydrogenase